MSTFWLVFHYALLVAAIVWIVIPSLGWAWGKIQGKFRPGL